MLLLILILLCIVSPINSILLMYMTLILLFAIWSIITIMRKSKYKFIQTVYDYHRLIQFDMGKTSSVFICTDYKGTEIIVPIELAKVIVADTDMLIIKNDIVQAPNGKLIKALLFPLVPNIQYITKRYIFQLRDEMVSKIKVY